MGRINYKLNWEFESRRNLGKHLTLFKTPEWPLDIMLGTGDKCMQSFKYWNISHISKWIQPLIECKCVFAGEGMNSEAGKDA